MAKKPSSFVVTANRTDDGVTVYRDAQGAWSEQFAAAHVHADKEGAEQALGAARSEERLVCDPYAFPVDVDATGKPVALTVREQIRAAHQPTCCQRRPNTELRA